MDKRKDDIFPSKDPVKKSLFFPKILLESANLWPEKRTLLAKTTNWICILFCVFIETGQICFVIYNIKDITKIASAMSTVSTTFQVIMKSLVVYFYSDKLKHVLSRIWFEFWPSKIGGVKVEQELKEYNSILIKATVVMFVSGICFAFGFLSAPLRNGVKVLPFESIYPFDWSKTPFYEILYMLEWLTNIAFIIVAICGHDYLFVGICSNIVGQYTLLKTILANLGEEKVAQINEQLAQFKKMQFKSTESEDGKLLKLCIAHHVMLKEVCRDVVQISGGCFSTSVQLFSSVTAICVAALIINFAEVDVTLFTATVSYMFGHLLQLFLFCTLGNEVTYHANQFPVSVFCSQWYNVDVSLQKDVRFLVDVAQKEVKILALGIKALDYETFIAVLKLSFSFYTMITKVTEHSEMVQIN